MKKIVYITNSRIPTEKAHGIQVMSMCMAFVEQGYDVDLLIPNRKNILTKDAFKFYGIEKSFRIKKLFTLDFVDYGWLGYWIQALSFAESVALSAFFDCIQKKDFIYYTRDEIIAIYLSNLGRRVVWESHVGKNNILTRFLVKRGVAIATISQGVADVYIKLGAKKEHILVAHDGVNLEQFSINESKKQARDKVSLHSDKKIALYSGHLYDWKGARTFAEAAKKIPDIDCVFVGGTDIDIKNFRDRYRVVPNIRIIGRVPHVDIPMYLKSADILILPNSGTQDISRLYTSPLKLFEYMASGVPIVASDVESLSEVLDESCAFFFEADNVDALAQKIMHALSNAEESGEKALVAKDIVKDYSWKMRAKKILDFVN